MSTHCIIAFKKGGSVTASFCYYDGYVLGAGRSLLSNFGSAELAEKLVSQGSMSCAKLGMSYADKKHCCGKIDFSALAGKPAAEVLQAVLDMPLGWTEEMFNEHLKENLPKNLGSKDVMKKLESYASDSDAEFIYLFDEDNAHAWCALLEDANGRWHTLLLTHAVAASMPAEGKGTR